MSEEQVTGTHSRSLSRIILAVMAILVVALVVWRLRTSSQKAQPVGLSTQNKAETPKQPSNLVQLSAEAIARGKIEIGDVITQTIHQSLDVPGRLALNEDSAVRIGTIVTGRVTRVLAMVGDSVKKGQSLVYIHSHELVDARAAEAKARAMVIEKEKALAFAKAELERAERLLEAKAISKREHALAAANVNSANAELDQAKAELVRSSEFLEHLTVPHDSHDDIVAYSPISGIVIKRNVSVGTVVSEATDLMMVANLSTLWAIAEVTEKVEAVYAPLLTRTRDPASALGKLPAEERARIERVAQQSADLFQRSSSCVEGRNGQLALRHHSLHRLTKSKLAALTVVHNYYVTRSDGTTAAERFFGSKPADLFDWLVDHLDVPARPASKRSKTAPKAAE